MTPHEIVMAFFHIPHAIMTNSSDHDADDVVDYFEWSSERIQESLKMFHDEFERAGRIRRKR